MKQALYFGCLNDHGHYLFDEQGICLKSHSVPSLPAVAFLDGGLLNRLKVLDRPDGRVYHSHLGNGWHAFVWWDRSYDTRSSSHSGFYVREVATTQEGWDYALQVFPKVIARQRFQLKPTW